MAGTEGVPLLVVVSGPSGVGKDTLLERLGELQHDMRLHFVVTATTRPPRQGERNGVNHHFVDRPTFEKMIARGELLEYANVYGNYYGVPKSQVRAALAEGKHVLLRVDVQGAERLRTVAPDAVFVFVLPPSLETLEARLRARGKDSPESIKTRLAAARAEIEQSTRFDYRIVNRDGALDESAGELISIIERESRRRPARSIARADP
jgi:guanylate kinase